jgi:hypothetical protein
VSNKKFKEPLADLFKPAIVASNIEANIEVKARSTMVPEKIFVQSAWFRVHRRIRIPLCRIINDYVTDRISRQLIERYMNSVGDRING